MARSTVHYADSSTNNILKRLHNKLRPAGTPVQRVEYIIELLLLRIFEVKLKQDPEFKQLRELFRPEPDAKEEADRERDKLLFSALVTLANDQILPTLNQKLFPFYARILSQARKVWKGNLSVKVQDQLVLIEEVFANSNFTNNVQSGQMAEVIGLVAELDEDRLLKTDLLGDAIESALSETGGTKDIGLHRTPDHIRQFMVGLAAPTFGDLLFDPTVGTGGFMFDAFEYVLQGVSRDGSWPGPKSHSELAAWFQRWFAEHSVPMPSHEISTDFYRLGVSGIEYLGMVRKMAAINFYVRGLNPANIQQGDSLDRFDPVRDANSKTVILANPPFGAERDKESYPNVWTEYPTESETTILFVKLMLETLKSGGRCAVIVSEGFLTWDQNSARALRRQLLEDCDLQAIISLPQGVFVSKGGQGPKTSILYFVKGRKTERVWFYKVTNDGYTMGTNRKQIPGCQFVEALELFDQFVREGREPPDSRHSFCVPADWIKTLDPRVKDRIREETRAEMGAKEAEDRAKLEKKLADQIAAKKLTASGRNERLAEHAELWRSKTDNLVAQRIDRAHLYSFNLPNYRSSLTASQLEEWHAFAATRQRDDETEKTLEQCYRAINTAAPDQLDELLSVLDPRHALELDIARQSLAGLAPELVAKHPHLRTLQDIIATQAKAPRVRLGELIQPRFEKIKKADYDGSLPIVEKISFADGKLHFRDDRETGMDLYRVRKGDLITSKINVHQGAVALAPCDLVASTHYQPYSIQIGEVVPGYLAEVLRTPEFIKQLNEQRNNGIKTEQGAAFLAEFEIPVPSHEVQEQTINEVIRQRSVGCATETIFNNYQLRMDGLEEFERHRLATVICDIQNGLYKPGSEYGEGTPILRINDFANGDVLSNTNSLKQVRVSDLEAAKFSLCCDDVVLNRVNSLEHVGKVALIGMIEGNSIFESNMMRMRFDTQRVLPAFVFRLLSCPSIAVQLKAKAKQAVNQFSVNQTDVGDLMIPIPPITDQRRILNELDTKLALLAGLRSLKDEAEQTIQQTLNRIWET